MAELIYVTAGPATKTGQVAVCEEHPDHPEDDLGVHMAYVVAGDPVCGSGQVALTPLVSSKISIGELVQTSKSEADKNYHQEATAEAAALNASSPNAATGNDGGQKDTAAANAKKNAAAAEQTTEADKANAEAAKEASDANKAAADKK